MLYSSTLKLKTVVDINQTPVFLAVEHVFIVGNRNTKLENESLLRLDEGNDV